MPKDAGLVFFFRAMMLVADTDPWLNIVKGVRGCGEASNLGHEVHLFKLAIIVFEKSQSHNSTALRLSLQSLKSCKPSE